MDFKNYVFRITNALLGAEFIPSRFRVVLMRWVGYDVSPDTKAIWSGSSFLSKRVHIEAGAFINNGFYYDGFDQLTICKNVHIAPFVKIITGSHEISIDPTLRASAAPIWAPVVIEEGCWIGTGSIILPGVSIRRGCVIGANATVTRSTEPHGLYVGSPARRIRDLPS